MPLPAVECRGVEKRFYYYEHRTTSLRELFIRSLRREPIHVRRPEFVLRDFDLTVEPGEAVALIGPNGSGKSTALRLIAGIYQPTRGTVRTRGSLAAVIELGAGLHPELTGSENVELYGAVMGLGRTAIRARFSEIVAFSGLEAFMGTPLKYYSTGMRTRLAFAVTVCLGPDVLLLDEVLAVGDRDFQAASLERLRSFHTKGGTLVIVSHDLATVRGLCARAAWLEGGRLRRVGPADEVVDAYLASGG